MAIAQTPITNFRHQDAGTHGERVSLVDYIITHCDRPGEMFNQTIFPEYRRNYSMWRGKPGAHVHVDKAARWRSTVVPPEGYRQVNSQLPRVYRGQFPHRNWAGVFALNGNAEYEKLIKSLTYANLHEMKFTKEALPFLQGAAVLGHRVGKVVYDIQTEDRVRDELTPVIDVMSGQFETTVTQRTQQIVMNSGPKFFGVNPFRIKQDPTGMGTWWIEDIFTIIEAMEEVNRRIPGTYINMEVLKQHIDMFNRTKGQGGPGGVGRSDKGGAVDPQDFIAEFEGIAHLNQRSTSWGTPVKLKQFWGYVPPEILWYGEDNTQWRLVVVANDRFVVRDVPAPTHNHRPPYFNVSWYPVFGRLWGASHLTWTHGLIDELTQLDRSRMDEILQSMHPTLVVNEDLRWQNKNFTRQLGGIARVKGLGPQGRTQFAAHVLEMKPVLNDAWRERAMLRQAIDDVGGGQHLFEGQAHSSRQTATEISTLEDQGNMQFGLVSAWVGMNLRAQVLERQLGLSQRFMHEEKMIRISGEEDRRVILSARDIQDPVDFILDEGVHGPWGLAQAGVLAQALDLATRSEAFSAWIKPREIFGEWIEALGIPNADRFLYTEDQLQQQQQQTAGLQAIVAQLANQPGADAGQPQPA